MWNANGNKSPINLRGSHYIAWFSLIDSYSSINFNILRVVGNVLDLFCGWFCSWLLSEWTWYATTVHRVWAFIVWRNDTNADTGSRVAVYGTMVMQTKVRANQKGSNVGCWWHIQCVLGDSACWKYYYK